MPDADSAKADARRWIAPFRRSFPDVHMRVVSLVADVDEVHFFRLRDGRIADMWGLEDNAARLLQLGLDQHR